MERMECRLSEVKFASGEEMSFEGYGAAFSNVDSYGDVIAPGAFAAYLSEVQAGKRPWPVMLSQHGGWGMSAEDLTPVGVWTHLSEDGKGLVARGRLAETPRARELYALMKMDPRPAIDGLSIGYIAKEWTPRSKPEEPRRTLKRIDLAEISLVTFPANGRARVGSVKSIEELGTIGDVEDFLRLRGMSKTEAVALIARIKSAGPGDPGSAGGPGDPVAEELVAALKQRGRALA